MHLLNDAIGNLQNDVHIYVSQQIGPDCNLNAILWNYEDKNMVSTLMMQIAKSRMR